MTRSLLVFTPKIPVPKLRKMRQTWLQELARGHHLIFIHVVPYVNLRLKYVWFSGYPTDNPSLPSLLTIFRGFPSSAIKFPNLPKPRALLSSYACALFLNTARTWAWNQLARSPRPCWYLRQMWSAKAQESMCVCTISSGSRSLGQKKSRHLRTLCLKYLSAVF